MIIVVSNIYKYIQIYIYIYVPMLYSTDKVLTDNPEGHGGGAKIKERRQVEVVSGQQHFKKHLVVEHRDVTGVPLLDVIPNGFAVLDRLSQGEARERERERERSKIIARTAVVTRHTVVVGISRAGGATPLRLPL